MKRNRSFKEGDLVFAKIKGYPPWPAQIVAKSGKKFKVQFYGTHETGFTKPEEMFYYLKSKEQMMKGSKKKEFKDAIDEIENVISELGTDGDEIEEDAPAVKRKRSNSEKSSDSVSKIITSRNSDTETESIVTDAPIESIVTNESVPESNTEDDVFESEEPIATNANIPVEEPAVIPAPSLVSENNLRSWIYYADMVKKSPDLYKSKPADETIYSENQVFPICLPSGKCLAIKLHKSWPVNFSSEYESALYVEETASRILQIKDSILSGNITEETDPLLYATNFDLTEAKIEEIYEAKRLENRTKITERLESESKLVEIDGEIKNCLGLLKADPKKALDLLGQMIEIQNIDEVMLKKHSHVVEMIRRLRKYIGNQEEWKMTGEELETFNSDAEKIRLKADDIYKKFKAVVNVTGGQFWEEFNVLLKSFEERCEGLSKDQFFTLCHEPDSRQAIIDWYEELHEEGLDKPAEAEAEKENVRSSGNITLL